MNRLVRLLRIQDWYYLLGIPLLAVLQHRGAIGAGRVAEVFAFSALYFCWGYVFNNLFDISEDAPARNSFISVDLRAAQAITSVLQILLLIFSIASGLFFETAIMCLLNALYSIPPSRLKRFLLPSLVSNGILFGYPYYAAAKILNGKLGPADLYYTLFVFSLFLPLQYVHSLEHREIEGRGNGFGHKAVAVLFFGLLCLTSALAQPGLRALLFPASAAYSVICLFVLFRSMSAALARTGVKYVSMGFGFYLAIATRLGGLL